MFKLKDPTAGLRGGMGSLGFEPVTITAGLTAASAILPSVLKLFDSSDTDAARAAQASAEAQERASQNALLAQIAKARAEQAAIITAAQAQAALAEQQGRLALAKAPQYAGYAVLGLAGIAALVGLFYAGKALTRR